MTFFGYALTDQAMCLAGISAWSPKQRPEHVGRTGGTSSEALFNPTRRL